LPILFVQANNRPPHGTTSRKHTKYSGKRVVRETVDIEQLQYDLGFEEIIPPQD